MGPFEFLLGALALLLIYRLVLIGLRRCGGGRETAMDDSSSLDDVELMRELHRGLLRMEQRIEALETLLGEQLDARKTAAGERKP